MRASTLLTPLFVLLLVLGFALPAAAADTPKEFLGVWALVVPAEVATQMAQAEAAASKEPADEMAKAMLEMLKVLATMEMEFTPEAVIMRAGGEEKERATWTAAKAEGGGYTLNVVDSDGKDSPATATFADGVMTIVEADGDPLQFTKKAAPSKADAKQDAKDAKKAKDAKQAPAKATK